MKRKFIIRIGLMALFLFCFVPLSDAADNLLQNYSFEEGTNNWTPIYSTMSFDISSNASDGIKSASLTKTNGSTGTIYIYQDVDIEPESFYTLSGAIRKNNSSFGYGLLRISWRDGSGEMSQTSSDKITTDSTAFQTISIAVAQAPANAVTARIELVANLTQGNPADPMLFDNILFSQIPPPEQPTPTSVPTATPKPSPTPTRIPTPTKYPTPIKTTSPSIQTSLLAKKSPSLSPPEASHDASATAHPSAAVLGELTSEKNSQSPSPAAIKDSSAEKFPLGTLLLLGGGICFVASCAILIFLQKRQSDL